MYTASSCLYYTLYYILKNRDSTCAVFSTGFAPHTDVANLTEFPQKLNLKILAFPICLVCN